MYMPLEQKDSDMYHLPYVGLFLVNEGPVPVEAEGTARPQIF